MATDENDSEVDLTDPAEVVTLMAAAVKRLRHLAALAFQAE